MAAVPEIYVNCEQAEELLPPVYEHNLSLSFPPGRSGDVCRSDAAQLCARPSELVHSLALSDR